MIEITSLPQLRGLTENDTHLTVIDFYADWCVPCQLAKPIFHQLSETFSAAHRGKAVFCTCNVDHQPECSRTWNITSLPTFLVFCGGRELLRDHSVDRLNRSLDVLLLQVRQTASSVSSPSGPGHTLSSTSVKGLRDVVTAKMMQLESIRQASAASSSSSSSSSSSVEFSPAAFTVITSISRLLHEGSTNKPFGLLLIPFLASSAPDGGGASLALEYLLCGMREQEGRDTGSTGLSTVPFSTLLVNNILRYVLQMALDLLWTDREEIDLLHHIFLSLLRSPVAESIIATSPYYTSDAPGILSTGVELEYQTILGAFFGLAPYSRLIPSTHAIGQPRPSTSLEEMTLHFFFPSASLSMGGGGGGAGGTKGDPLLPSEEEMQLKTKDVQLIVDALALRNNALTKALLRSKVLREPTLRFFSLALKLNEGHQKTVMKHLPLSSAYFLTQLQLVLLEAAKPIFDPFRDQSMYQETLDDGASSSSTSSPSLASLPTDTTATTTGPPPQGTSAHAMGSGTKAEEEEKPEALLRSTALLPPSGPAKHPVATAIISRLPPSYLIDEDPMTGGALTSYGNEVERVMHFDADHPLPPLPADFSPSLPHSSHSSSSSTMRAVAPPVAAHGTTHRDEGVSEAQRGGREEHKDPDPRQGDAPSAMTNTGNLHSTDSLSLPHTEANVSPSFASSSASLSFPSAHPPSTTTAAAGMGKGKSSPMEKYKPMTHLFFLALRAMTVITIPMIDQVKQLQQEMDYFTRHLRQAGGQLRYDVRHQYSLRGLFVVRNGLLSGATQTKLRLTFLNDVALWLLCLMQVSFSTGVLPASPPMEWQYLPQEIVDAPIKGTALTDLSSMYVPHLNGLLLILMGNKVYFPKPHTHVFSYLLVRLLHDPVSRDGLQHHMWFTRHIIKSCMLCYIAVEKAYYERVQVRYDLSTCLKHFLEIPSLSEAVREEFCDPKNPTLEQFSHMAVAELNEAIDEMIQSLKKMKKKQSAQAKVATNNASRASSAAPPTLSLSGAPGSSSSRITTAGGGDGGNAQEEESNADTDDNDEGEEESEEHEEGEERQQQQRQQRGGGRRGPSYEELGHRLQSSISLFYSSTDLFISLSKCFPAGISQNMVAQQLAQVLARSLVTFAGKQSAQLKIADGAQFEFEPRRILCSLVSCLSPLSMRTSFVRCLCDCGTPKADIIDAIDRVVSRELVPSLQQMHLNRIKDAVIRLSDAVEEEQRLWEDAPDFALDALLSTPLTEPIALPTEVKDLENLVYVNKSTIHHLLLSDSKHPFTKEYLDEPMLQVFNAKPEVMAAVKSREEMVKEWLQEAQKTRTNSA